jgi:type IV fimbrial biogenesis protein FimT
MLAVKKLPKPAHIIAMKKSGFTLIELLVTIALLAIISGLAAPSMREVAANQALSNSVSSLMSATLAARGAAIKESRRVIIQPTSGTDWTMGWTVHIDRDNNSTFDAGTDTLVISQEALSSSVTVVSAASLLCTGTSAAGNNLFAYDGSGFLVNVGGNFNGHVLLTSNVTGRNRCLVVDRAGRARTCEPNSTSSPC